MHDTPDTDPIIETPLTVSGVHGERDVAQELRSAGDYRLLDGE